jgi:16S rRNA G527 N7-methylase RsmG
MRLLGCSQPLQVELYVSTLLAWNEKMNLVAASQASREQARLAAAAVLSSGSVPV